MKLPFFSIVIPTLNEERYLPILLASLNGQIEKNLEVIVVDGLSKDKTPKLVEEFAADFPLRLVKHRANNVGEQRNHGAKLARGEYLIFFDADVWVKPDFLMKLKNLLLGQHVSFASPLIILDSKKWVDRVLELFINAFMVLLTTIGKPLMTGQAFIIKRQPFMKIGGFDPTIVHAEDGELAQRAARNKLKGKILTSLEVFVSARRFDKEGRLIVLLKYIQANIYMAFFGPIRKHLFIYKMGGEHQ